MSERTEQPTPKRIREARLEGNVARSPELSAAIVLLAGLLLLRGPARQLANGFGEWIKVLLIELPHHPLDANASLSKALTSHVGLWLPWLGLTLGGILAAAVTVNLAQTGFLWSSKRLGFHLDRLDPIKGFKRLFSLHSLLELAKALIKLFLIGGVSFAYLRPRLPLLLGLNQNDAVGGLSLWLEIALGLAFQIAIFYLILAALDYGYQRWNYLRSLRMTREEIKEELKQTEGDPLLRSRIRSYQQRLARTRMMANVPKATVVITNPTHVAVALAYEPATMRAPKVIAKGVNLLAQRIKEVARANRVAIVENPPLARLIYQTVDLDQEIPPELYTAVAEVLAYVYRLNGSLSQAVTT